MSKTSNALDLNLDTLISDMRQGAEDFCNSRAVVNLSCREFQSAAEELERLREERDEARREICENQIDYHGSLSIMQEAEKRAENRGWDCYRGEP